MFGPLARHKLHVMLFFVYIFLPKPALHLQLLQREEAQPYLVPQRRRVYFGRHPSVKAEPYRTATKSRTNGRGGGRETDERHEETQRNEEIGKSINSFVFRILAD